MSTPSGAANRRRSTPLRPSAAVASSPSGGQLTGVPRRLKDAAAECFNAIQTWNAAHLRGVAAIKQIVEIKLNCDGDGGSGDRAGDSSGGGGGGTSELDGLRALTIDNGGAASQYPDSLRDVFADLEAATQSLTAVVGKMRVLRSQVESTVELCRRQQQQRSVMSPMSATKRDGGTVSSPLSAKKSGAEHRDRGGSSSSSGSDSDDLSDDDDGDVIFLTWPSQKFVATFERLYRTYAAELSLRRTMSENICHSTDRDRLNFQLYAWTHQPYVDAGTTLALEAMLTEVGHRPF